MIHLHHGYMGHSHPQGADKQAQSEGSVGIEADTNHFIAHMYESAFHLPLTAFKDATLASIADIIPCTSGIWASGVHVTNTIFSVAAYNYPPDRMIEYAFNWQDHDFVRDAAVKSPGKAFRNEDVMPLDAYHQTDIYRHFSGPSGIEHALGAASADPITTVGELIFLFRSDPAAHFSDEDCARLELLLPHLVAVWRHRQMLHLFERDKGQKADLESLSSGHAVVDDMGFIQAADDDFSRQMRTAFADWTGPLLPAPIFALLTGDKDSLVCGAHRFVLMRGDGRHIVKVLGHGGDAWLTPAEQRTATLFAEGKTSSHIASTLDLSTATVRNQIAAAYSKLGVHTKVELLRALSKRSQ
ncbi:MAG: helix-turn-helix transcriptional regulator [Chakrabartia sp.]